MDSSNPYAAPRSEPRGFAPRSSRRSWLLAWLFIGGSGAAFGIVGGPLGVVIGGVLATVIAAVLTGLVFVILPESPTSLTVMIAGGICGFLTGGISTLLVFGSEWWLCLIAAVIGSAAGASSAFVQPRMRAIDKYREPLHDFDRDR